MCVFMQVCRSRCRCMCVHTRVHACAHVASVQGYLQRIQSGPALSLCFIVLRLDLGWWLTSPRGSPVSACTLTVLELGACVWPHLARVLHGSSCLYSKHSLFRALSLALYLTCTKLKFTEVIMSLTFLYTFVCSWGWSKIVFFKFTNNCLYIMGYKKNSR